MALVYLDTNVFIQAFESNIAIAAPARALLEALERHPGHAATSELTIAELLAPAKAAGALTLSEKLAIYDVLFQQELVATIPISRQILRETAILRQSFPQKLPDAIHVVTAMQAGCRFLLSSDRDTKRAPISIERLGPTEAGVSRILDMLRG